MAAAAHFYPWQLEQRDRLIDQRAGGKLPHALLLSGPAFLGKRDFAVALGHLFLCTSPEDAAPCGECAGCRLVNAGTHPDFRIIEPEDSRQILIDQIRDLIDWVSQTSQRGGLKVVIIHPAEKMNINAANALLKCLEEPSNQTLLMLVSDLPGRLLPTIRSRCQAVNFTMPRRESALAWLREHQPGSADPELLLGIASGAPLAVQRRYDEDFLTRRKAVARALEHLSGGKNPLELAGGLVKQKTAQEDASLAVEILYNLVTDALRYALSGDENLIKNKDLVKTVKTLSGAMGVAGLIPAIDVVTRERQVLASTSNPNPQLLMEGLLVEIAGLCAL